jgi:EpsI family protein
VTLHKASRWIPALVFAVGILLILLTGRQQRMPLLKPLSGLPASLFGIVGQDMPISAEEQAIAGMSSFVLRQFIRGDTAFSIYVGYYEAQVQGRSIHSPKNCLPGAGWEPISAGSITLPVSGRQVSVNRYVLGKESAMALVYYWYQGRGRIAWNEYRVKWDLLRDKAVSGRSDEALVRIVVPFTGNVAAADSLAMRIAAELIPDLDERLPLPPRRAHSPV